jgi:predicted nuclease with TOPRIM domain
MPEANGSGRLDRIEANLEKTTQRLNELTETFHLMVDRHEDEFKRLMTWQVLMQERFEKLAGEQQTERLRLNELSEKTDRRIADLVGAIGKLIDRMPLSSSSLQ